jgi:hypothetical protein
MEKNYFRVIPYFSSASTPQGGDALEIFFALRDRNRLR